LPHPPAHRLIARINAEAPEDLCLSMQRHVIGVLRRDHLRQQARARRALLYRLRRLARCLHRAVAGVFFADVLDYDQLRRNVFVALAGLFAELAMSFAPCHAMLLRFVRIMHDAFALQVRGQRSTATLCGTATVRR